MDEVKKGTVVTFVCNDSDKRYNEVGVVVGSWLFPNAEIKLQVVSFKFGQYQCETSRLNILDLDNLSDDFKQKYEQLKRAYPIYFKKAPIVTEVVEKHPDQQELTPEIALPPVPVSQVMPLYPNSVILDTETTGIKPDSEICEISVIDIFDNVLFSSLVKPLNPIPPELTEFHGITNEMVADAPSFAEIHTELSKLLAGKDVIAYNASFDAKMLISNADQAGVDLSIYQYVNQHARCAMNAYANFYGEPSRVGMKSQKLVNAAIQQGVQADDAHRALSDCKTTLSILIMARHKWESKLVTNKPVETPANVVAPTQVVQNAPEAAKTAVATTFGIENAISFTQAVISFDNAGLTAKVNAIADKYKGLVFTEENTSEVKAILAELRREVKSIDDTRKDIKNQFNVPLTEFEGKIKQSTENLNKVIGEIANKLAGFETEKRETKKAEVMELMAEMLNAVDLPKEYLAKITFKEEYSNASLSMNKIKAAIQDQIDVQVQLYQAVKTELELKQQKIKNRELLIANLNHQYGFNAAYSQLPIEMYTDDQVDNFYRNKKELQDAEKAKIEAQKAAQQAVQAANKPTAIVNGTNTGVQTTVENAQKVQEFGNHQTANNSNNNVSLSQNFALTIEAGSPERNAKILATFVGIIQKEIDKMNAVPSIKASFEKIDRYGE